ncbi:YiaA/YiaB family inner membrane protein [Longispora albida]|uniref:YiaA/YiaB family inner membrane protein n=1 Tax=Longispora albida TaxID=203523 RepID=UPI0003607DBE|nr:YiaA/YiaB family inner membrane protein [Longispora albida]
MKNTTAFYVQSILAFATSLGAMVIGIVYLPVGPWVRGFLAIGLLFVVTSAFTLAKTIRDKQESDVISPADQARLAKMLATPRQHNTQ